jgi:hypothetical protein
MSPNLKQTIMERVRRESGAELKSCLAAFASHASLMQELSARSLLPGTAKLVLEKMRAEPLPDASPENLLCHAKILADLQAVADNKTVQNEARRTANKKFLEVEPAVNALELAVTSSLERQTAEAVQAEREFFEGHGLPWEPTSLSKLPQSLAVQSASFRSGKAQILALGGTGYVPRLSMSDFGALVADH